MRDPARIDEILDLLDRVWRLDPDLRLGQLIFNAARFKDPDITDIYSIEDGSLRMGLIRYLQLKESQVSGEAGS